MGRRWKGCVHQWNIFPLETSANGEKVSAVRNLRIRIAKLEKHLALFILLVIYNYIIRILISFNIELVSVSCILLCCPQNSSIMNSTFTFAPSDSARTDQNRWEFAYVSRLLNFSVFDWLISLIRNFSAFEYEDCLLVWYFASLSNL